MPTLDQRDDVFVLDIGDTENRFHPDWIAALGDLLDHIERATGPRALVTTATGKFYSNGLDLEWLAGHTDQTASYLEALQRLFARMLTLPLVTVAAVQGHAFAAGAMFSLTHDFRVMRADRGYWCLPEVDLGMPFTPGMSALIQARLSPATAHEAMITGRRYGGEDARAAGIVEHTAALDALAEAAWELGHRQAGKAGGTLSAIKSRLYQPVLSALADTGLPAA